MMRSGKQVPMVWCIALLFIWGVLCSPAMAASEEAGILQPLAMGTSGDAPVVSQEEPKVGEPTLMIRLGSAHFDPLYKQPVPASGAPVIQAFAEGATGYYVVQFDGPVRAQWKAALVQAGAEIFDYVPDFAFMVRMNSDNEDAVRALAHVRWVGIFQPSFRISQQARGLMYTQSDQTAAATVALRVNLFPGVNLAQIESRIQALGGEIKETSSTKIKTTTTVEIPTENISALTGINGIKWIEPLPKFKLFNNVSTDIMNARTPRNTHGLYGSGQTVAVADTGLDQGSVSPGSLHDDFENGAGATRVVALLDSAGDGSTSDTNGHGTHVAGSVLGNGAMSGSDPTTNFFPATCFAGLAPKANLVFQAVMDNTTGGLSLPPDLNTLFGAAQSAGADLHTNSWGSSIASQYSASSEDVDEFMWNNKNFLIQFSAGNSGVDKDADGVIDLYSLGAPATAKNCLTVGASEGDRPSGAGADGNWGGNDTPVAPIAGDHVSDNDRGMAAFSSRGPTLDGRYKPDIVAPGTNILSARSSLGGTGWGVYNDDYIWMGGTSMSNPLTAGASTLMREYLIGRPGGATPSAALIKAALLNSAEDITPGQYGFGATQEIPDSPVPNNVEGWGRLNLGDGVYPSAPANILYFDETAGLNTGGSQEHEFYVTHTSAPLKVNLVWTDYPGTPAAEGGLVNDLDLMVTAPGSVISYPDHALQKSSLSPLDYTTGYLSGYSSDIRAIRFEPSAYPALVESVSFVYNNPSDGINDVDVVVYDDDGAGGLPGTQLFRTTLSYVPSGWTTIGIQGVAISSGEFYVALEKTDTNADILVDTGNPTGRSYFYDDISSAWVVSGFTAYIKANVRTTDFATSFDRVNNTLGVTIDTPTVGLYTVQVAGYNVPQGPQPYALVASGNIQEYLSGALQLGAATYSVDEDAGTIDIIVNREDGSDGAVAVSYATADGTATAGSDYTAASGTLNWANLDSTPKTITISITDDSDGENNETFTVTLTNPTNGATMGTIDTATLTINLNDGGPPGGGGGGGGCFIDTASLLW